MVGRQVTVQGWQRSQELLDLARCGAPDVVWTRIKGMSAAWGMSAASKIFAERLKRSLQLLILDRVGACEFYSMEAIETTVFFVSRKACKHSHSLVGLEDENLQFVLSAAAWKAPPISFFSRCVGSSPHLLLAREHVNSLLAIRRFIRI